MNVATSLPRADRPYMPSLSRGPVRGVDLHVGGLRPAIWILLAYLLVMVTVIDEEWPTIGRVQPTLLLGILLLAACFGQIGLRGLARTPESLLGNRLGVWWAALAAASVLSTVWAWNVGLAVDAEREFLLGLLGYPAIVLLVRTRREVVLVCMTLVAGHAFYLLRSFSEFLNGRIVGASDLARMVGAGATGADPNSFAATIVFSLPLVIWLAFVFRSRWLRCCCIAYAVLGAYCIVMTRSRAGLVLLGLVAAWTLLVIPSRRLRVAACVGIVLGGIVLAGRLSGEEMQRYETIVSSDTYEKEESTRGRVDGYRIGLQILRAHPGLGVGLGNWSAYRSARIDGNRLMPHTLGGQLFAELGAVGTLAFLGYVVAAFGFGFSQMARLRRDPDPWAQAVRLLLGAQVVVLACLLVSGLAAHNLFREGWALAPGLMLAAVHCRKEPQEEQPRVP